MAGEVWPTAAEHRHEGLGGSPNQHRSAHYLLKQVSQKKTTPVIQSNLFLSFGVK